MSGSARRGAGALWFLISLLLYIAFAAIVYVAQGPEPELSVDHVAYFKMVDSIRAQYPDGGYWRSFDTFHSYSVLVAYLSDLTASHITSLKLLLAGMTVAYLIAFERLALLFTESRPLAVSLSLLSALFVSFGASFWGFTDFAASLHRTLVVPFFVWILWFFIRFYDSPWRYAMYPLLVALSVLHLSTYHMLLVLLAFEPIDFLFLRKRRVDRRLLYFGAGLLAAWLTRELVAWSGLGFANYVDDSITRAWGASGNLSPPEAWVIELYAFPWRNMPLPLATLANLALSYGVIFALSVASAIAVRRREGWTPLDRFMLAFSGAVVAASYGPQTLLWLMRDHFPIYPISFEEVRAINFMMIPSLYFVSRLVAILWREEKRGHRLLVAAIVVGFALQPVFVLRALPLPWREALLERMSTMGMLQKEDSFRTLYARQYLGLAGEGPRFYYAARGVIDWLTRNVKPDDRLMTNRNEFRIAGLEAVGPFQNVVTTGIIGGSRRQWRDELDAVAAALGSRDIDEVTRVAKELGATIVVVPWQEPGALYQDDNYSVLRVN